MAIKANSGETSSSSTELNFLGGGTVVEGTIKTDNSVRVDGTLKGKLICKKTLTVGVNGEIEGEIEQNSGFFSKRLITSGC